MIFGKSIRRFVGALRAASLAAPSCSSEIYARWSALDDVRALVLQEALSFPSLLSSLLGTF
jgi:hypothetical protein